MPPPHTPGYRECGGGDRECHPPPHAHHPPFSRFTRRSNARLATTNSPSERELSSSRTPFGFDSRAAASRFRRPIRGVSRSTETGPVARCGARATGGWCPPAATSGRRAGCACSTTLDLTSATGPLEARSVGRGAEAAGAEGAVVAGTLETGVTVTGGADLWVGDSRTG